MPICGTRFGGQIHLAQPLQHVLAIHVAGGVVVEDQHQAGEAGQRGGAQMGEVGNAGHLDFDRHRDLALDLFGAAARPLGDDLDVVVGDVGVGLDGQVAERDDAPGGEHHHAAEHQPAVLEREIDECANHLLVPRCFKQQCVGRPPAGRVAMPERISCRLPSSICPARTSVRLN